MSGLIDEGSGEIILYARDAETGKSYLLAGEYYKVVVLQKNYAEEFCTSVLVETESETHPIQISGETNLIAFNKLFYKRRDVMKTKATKTAKVTKEATPTMTSIIRPMLDGKHDVNEVAAAVVAQFPAKKLEGVRRHVLACVPYFNAKRKNGEAKCSLKELVGAPAPTKTVKKVKKSSKK